jgi:hypothetical protein
MTNFLTGHSQLVSPPSERKMKKWRRKINMSVRNVIVSK